MLYPLNLLLISLKLLLPRIINLQLLKREMPHRNKNLKYTPKNILISDGRSEKEIRRNIVDSFSTSRLILKIFALKTEEFVM